VFELKEDLVEPLCLTDKRYCVSHIYKVQIFLCVFSCFLQYIDRKIYVCRGLAK
jgi:hypothetical protein